MRETAKSSRSLGPALVDALAQSAFTVMSVLSRIGAAHDLSLTQMRVFGVLRDRRPRMAELAELLGLDKSTMSGLVDRATERGLVSREKSAGDGRAYDVVLTPTGHAKAKEIVAEIADALAPMTARLDAGEKKQLVALLEKMLTAGST